MTGMKKKKIGIIDLTERQMYTDKCKCCKGDIKIRNPKGYCDHLYYPENCNGKCVPSEEVWEPYVRKWSEQGRGEDQIWAVRNFMTGQGSLMLKDLLLQSRKDVIEEIGKMPHGNYYAIKDILQSLQDSEGGKQEKVELTCTANSPCYVKQRAMESRNDMANRYCTVHDNWDGA